MTNVHRHSGSKTAQVHIAREGDNIEVEVADQGKGMPERRLSEVRSLRIGVGIAGMRERLRKAHGKLTIESNALGTKIRATFPAKALAKKADNESERRGVA